MIMGVTFGFLFKVFGAGWLTGVLTVLGCIWAFNRSEKKKG